MRATHLVVVVSMCFAATRSTAAGDVESERAIDHAKTMDNVSVYRARGEYENAELELRGFLQRWASAGLDRPGFEGEAARIRELMKQMVAARELLERAETDVTAARDYLKLVTKTAQPTRKAAEQARALNLLAKHDKRVRDALRRSFPARLVIEVNGEVPLDDLVTIPMTNAAVEMSTLTGLPIWGGHRSDGGDMAVLKVQIEVRENDRSESFLRGTGMRSFAFMMTGRLTSDEGKQMVAVATTQNTLGINAANATKYGVERVASRLYEDVLDAFAKKAALDML